MKKRSITVDDAKHYINTAKVMFKQVKDTINTYYAEEGVSAVIINGGILRTAFPKSQFDDSAKLILEVVNKYVK
jgi:hypothetical protein